MNYYVAMPFIPMDHGLAPGQAVECPSETAAIRRAEAMSHHAAIAGAVAFSRSGDPETFHPEARGRGRDWRLLHGRSID